MALAPAPAHPQGIRQVLTSPPISSVVKDIMSHKFEDTESLVTFKQPSYPFQRQGINLPLIKTFLAIEHWVRVQELGADQIIVFPCTK